jgi:hypothetical protein
LPAEVLELADTPSKTRLPEPNESTPWDSTLRFDFKALISKLLKTPDPFRQSPATLPPGTKTGNN